MFEERDVSLVDDAIGMVCVRVSDLNSKNIHHELVRASALGKLDARVFESQTTLIQWLALDIYKGSHSEGPVIFFIRVTSHWKVPG